VCSLHRWCEPLHIGVSASSCLQSDLVNVPLSCLVGTWAAVSYSTAPTLIIYHLLGAGASVAGAFLY
jgi:hypothetical protein